VLPYSRKVCKRATVTSDGQHFWVVRVHTGLDLLFSRLPFPTFEDKYLRKTFGPNRVERSGYFMELHKEEYRDFCDSTDNAVK